jgi:hypothetical protein
MTDARFPERWLNDRRVVRLSDRAFRLFVTSLAWSVANRTDGRLYPDDLALLLGVDPGAAGELVKAGLWSAAGEGWQVVDFGHTQTTEAQLVGLEHKRAMDRERQARKRAHDRGDHRVCLPEHCDPSRDVTRDFMRDTKDRPGQARTGASNGATDEADSQLPVSAPGAGEALRAPAPCPHGVVGGDQPDPWLSGRLSCPECASADDAPTTEETP